MANEIIDMNILFNKPVLVYGAGVMARAIAKMLLHKNPNFIGIAVTSLSPSDKNDCEGIKICQLEQWQEHAKDAVVLIATSYCYHEEIKKHCLSHGFNNVVSINKGVVCEAFKTYLSEKGISMDGSSFNIANGNYINPIIEEVPVPELIFACVGDFVVPPVFNDFSMVHEGPYEYGEVKLSKGDIVLDLGANMGVFSVFAASKGCTSYAFEPTPEMRATIERHSALNDNRIHHEQYAISNKNEPTVFLVDPLSCASNTLVDEMLTKRNVAFKELPVNQITVDEFVKQEKLERVDFIKADIEGAERLMLEGARETLKKFAPKLSLCTYHLPDDKEVLTELILKANPNYKIEYKWEKLYAHV